jgi:hypothetical protein
VSRSFGEIPKIFRVAVADKIEVGKVQFGRISVVEGRYHNVILGALSAQCLCYRRYSTGGRHGICTYQGGFFLLFVLTNFTLKDFGL